MKEGWEAKKLVDICKIQYGYPFDSKQFCDDSKYPQLIRIRDVSRGYSETYYSGEIPDGYFIDKGDYLIGMDGEFNIAAWNSERALLNQRVCKITANDETFDRFLYYNLRIILKQIEDETPFVTVKHLSAKRLNAVTINTPPLSEQQHIVEELDLLSSIIEKKKTQLNELDNLAQSLFYEMFGDPITNENGWEVKKIGEIGKVITGSTPSTKDEGNYNSCDYCFIKPSDIAKDNVTRLFESEFHISCKAYDNSRQLPKGSVLVTCIGIVGKVGILEVNATCNQQINAIVPYSFVQSRYLAYSILLQKKVIESIANAPVVPIINKKEFSLLSTPIPPLELQQQFASKIEAIEHQKELIKQSIKEVETLFNSRMDYYFN